MFKESTERNDISRHSCLTCFDCEFFEEFLCTRLKDPVNETDYACHAFKDFISGKSITIRHQ